MLNLDERTTLEVKSSKLTLVLTILLGLFFVPMGVGSIISGVRSGRVTFGLGLGLAMLLLFGLFIFIFAKARKKAVRYFSASGIGLADSSEAPRVNLLRVVDKIALRNGRQIVWRTELEFAGGRTAWLIPNKISNFDDIYAYVKSLPCEQAEEAA